MTDNQPKPAAPKAAEADAFAVGSHDPQNPEGKPRTERPGELLGSAPEAPDHITEGTELNADRADLVAKAVDNANRFALPKLGGNDMGDTWEADKATLEDAKKTAADNRDA